LPWELQRERFLVPLGMQRNISVSLVQRRITLILNTITTILTRDNEARAKKTLVLFLMVGFLFLGATRVVSSQSPPPSGPVNVNVGQYINQDMSPEVQAAIRESLTNDTFSALTKKNIKPDLKAGLFNIPRAPTPNLMYAFLWAIWIGWIFSTVGAFGGIMAGVGHITIFGFGDYAQGFGSDHPLNKLITDSIRVSNQWLVGFGALVSSYNYYRLGRLVLPIALSLSIGAVSGSYLIPKLTAGLVTLKAYIGYFGLIVLFMGGYLYYQTTAKGRSVQQEALNAARAFERSQKVTTRGDTGKVSVKILSGSLGSISISLVLVLVGVLCGNVLKSVFWAASYLAYGFILIGLMSFLYLAPKEIRFTYDEVEFSFKTYIPVLVDSSSLP